MKIGEGNRLFVILCLDERGHGGYFLWWGPNNCRYIAHSLQLWHNEAQRCDCASFVLQ